MSATSQSIRKSEPSCSASGPHALLQRLALIGEGELGALRRQRLGDPPGERAVVGEAHDQPALALPSSRSFTSVPPCFADRLASAAPSSGLVFAASPPARR